MQRRHSYFWTLLLRSLMERRGRVLVCLLTVALGTSVVGAFILLNADVETKMSKELRAYGANFVVNPRLEGDVLNDEVLSCLEALVPSQRLMGVQPFLYDIVHLENDRVAAAGIHFANVQKTTPYWQLVRGAFPPASARSACLLGSEAAKRLAIEVGQEVELAKGNGTHRCTVAALVETGGAEDDQLFLPIEEARTLFTRPGEIDLVLASMVADFEEAEAFARAVERAVPGSSAQPIRKLARAEGMILERIRSLMYMVGLLVTFSAFVSLLISLVATIAERRKEMALMKALGATDRGMRFHLLAEVGVTAFAGGHVGLAAGFGMAAIIEHVLFGTTVTFQWWVAPLVLAVALGIGIAGAAIVSRTIAAVQPAVALKGD